MEHAFTDQNFAAEVLGSPLPVLVDFWAEWCGPCRLMSPIVEQLGQELDAGKIKVGKMNVDDNQQTAQAYGVMSIPTFLVFKGGKVVEQFLGVISKEAFKQKLAKYV